MPQKYLHIDWFFIAHLCSFVFSLWFHGHFDISGDKYEWNQSRCPWNESENTNEHKCAIKNESICKYFCGMKQLDNFLCSYPHKSMEVLLEKEDSEVILHKEKLD